MHPRTLSLITLGAALTLVAAAHAQDEPAHRAPTPDAPEAAITADKPLFERERLLGDWWGARTALAEKGITFTIDWTQTVQGVVSGGRDEDWETGAHLDYILSVDLGKAGLLPGAFVKARAESRFGDSVNTFAGSVLPVNTIAFFPLTNPTDDEIPIALTELTYTQFFAPWIGAFVGKIQTLDGDLNEFASGRGKSQFLNANFIFNAATALDFPYSTLGAGVVILPSQYITISSTVMNTADSSTSSGFDDFGDGWTWATEAKFQYALGALPGGMNVGFIYTADTDFQQIGGRLGLLPNVPRDTEDETWALYWSGWQYLFTLDEPTGPIRVDDGVPDLRGLGLFARFGFADEDTNPIEWSGSLGLGGRGLVPSRDNDTFGLGVFYTKLQDLPAFALVGLDDESYGGELFYNLSITPAIDLTVDLQVLAAAFDNLDTTTIVGFRLNMRF